MQGKSYRYFLYSNGHILLVLLVLQALQPPLPPPVSSATLEFSIIFDSSDGCLIC